LNYIAKEDPQSANLVIKRLDKSLRLLSNRDMGVIVGVQPSTGHSFDLRNEIRIQRWYSDSVIAMSNANRSPYPSRLSVAPMMDWTDRHCRYFHRLLSRHALLYTEMVTTGALLHGDVPRHLTFNAEEHPVALAIGR
jgi:hypothetical protein